MFERSSSNLMILPLVLVLLLVMGLGCGGSGATCVGELSVDGKTYQGRDPSEAQARQNTCSKYCIEGDQGYDRLYQEFAKTPEAKKIPGLDKWAAQAQNKKLGEYVKQCEQDCMNQHKDGTRKIDVKCQ